MANVSFLGEKQVQLSEVFEDGTGYKVMPINTSKDVIVGSLENGSLDLPGDNVSEMLEDTLKNIRKWLYNLSNVAANKYDVSSDITDPSESCLATTKAVGNVQNAVNNLSTQMTAVDITLRGKAPTNHASSGKTYGGGTDVNYGHVKLSDDYVGTGLSASDSVAASSNAVTTAYATLNNNKANKVHTASDGNDIGMATTVTYGHVRLCNDYDITYVKDGKPIDYAATQYGLFNAWKNLKTRIDPIEEQVPRLAPTSHASTTATTYGAGNGSNYGHVKLCDEYNRNVGSAANSIAASQSALYNAYTALNTSIGNKASKTYYGDTFISVGRKASTTVGTNSIAYGTSVTASGTYSQAFGYNTTASGDYGAHTEGFITTASGDYGAHAEGNSTTASGSSSHAEGTSTTASGAYSHAEGASSNLIRVALSGYTASTAASTITTAWVSNKFSLAHGNFSHVEGQDCLALAQASHAEGVYTTASGANGSHAEGRSTTASGDCSHTEGFITTASGSSSHAEGNNTTANNSYSHAEGYGSIASAVCSHAGGYDTTSSNFASTAIGKYNKAMTTGGGVSTNTGDVFVVGNGTSSTALGNAMRLEYSGNLYVAASYVANGADYAEFVKPWYDGNPDDEDRVGYFVTVKDGYIHKANDGDVIYGITSGNPSVIGNGDEDYYWKYERDEFNRVVWEDVEEIIEEIDPETGDVKYIKTGKIIPNGRMKISKDYDPSKQYVERKDRKEWDYVGMMGILSVRDDGTCKPDQFCKCGKDGIATLATERGFDTFIVLERVSSNVVRVKIGL